MADLILFEDERAGRFEPIALTRSVARLRWGRWTHRARWGRLFPDRAVSLICRRFLAEVESASGEWVSVNEVAAGEDVLFVAAALGRASPGTGAAIRSLEPGSALLQGGRLLAARTTGEATAALAGALGDLAGEGPFPGEGAPDWPRVLEAAGLAIRDASPEPLPDTLVDLVAANATVLEADLAAELVQAPSPDPTVHRGVHLLSPERIWLGEGVELDAGVVLDARGGPIRLGPRTRVMAGSIVRGPVAAGADCILRPAARVTNGVSLGPVCRIGGEVDATIVQGWSNKQHDGFLGHSYLGCWVNLGAATDTSDLKNDYGPVRVTIAGETVDTGRRNVGSLIGDHSKTAIHTALNTGTVIGVSANVFGAGFPAREIPSFTWGGDRTREEYRLGKAVRVAMTVTARRGLEFGPVDEWLFTRIHRATEERRRAWLGSQLH